MPHNFGSKIGVAAECSPDVTSPTTIGRRTLLTSASVVMAGTLSSSAASLGSDAPGAGGAQAVLKSGPAIISSQGGRSVMEASLSRAGAIGTGEADDTGAIQAAIDEVERNTRFETDNSNTPHLGPGDLVWPQGLFLVNDAIRIRRSLRLRGEGRAEYSSGARIQQQNPGHDLFRVEPIAQGCSISLENLVLRANGGGGSGGALLRIIKTDGQCNSIRIVDSVFATPQTHAIDITNADDILIDRCLFDVSAVECVRMGHGAGAGVSNVRISRNNFYGIASECIVLGKAETVLIDGNSVAAARATRTFVRILGEPGPATIITVRGNTLQTVDCAVDAVAVTGLVVEANNGDGIGGGVLPRRAAVTMAGMCKGVVVTGNRFSGPGMLGFYDDQAAKVADAVIVANGFTGLATSGAAFRSANTIGRIGDNQVSGAALPAVGHRWSTTDNAGRPGTIRPHGSKIVEFPCAGAMPGDHVEVDYEGSFDASVMLNGRAKAGAIDVHYVNTKPQPIIVPPHDLRILVTR